MIGYADLAGMLLLKYFNYYFVVLENCNEKYTDKVYKLQYRAAKVFAPSVYETLAGWD